MEREGTRNGTDENRTQQPLKRVRSVSQSNKRESVSAYFKTTLRGGRQRQSKSTKERE